MRKIKNTILLLLCLTFVLTSGNNIISAAKKSKSISISIEELTCIKGYAFKIKIKNYKGTINWSSDNEKIASVDTKGKVKALSAGECYIIADIGKEVLSCKVTVVENYDTKKLIKYIKKNIGSSKYKTQSYFQGSYYKDYYYEKFFNNCLRYVGVPTNGWADDELGKIDGYNIIYYLLKKKCAKEIKLTDVKVGDFITWYDEEYAQKYADGYDDWCVNLIYAQPKIVTKVDSDGTFYVADLKNKNLYEEPSYFYYYPERYNTKDKAWNPSPKRKYTMKAIRLVFK